MPFYFVEYQITLVLDYSNVLEIEDCIKDSVMPKQQRRSVLESAIMLNHTRMKQNVHILILGIKCAHASSSS